MLLNPKADNRAYETNLEKRKHGNRKQRKQRKRSIDADRDRRNVQDADGDRRKVG